MMSYIQKCSVFIITIFFIKHSRSHHIANKTDIDYTDLAKEAETHKNDLLAFLNQTRVRNQYKLLYDNLLRKLLDAEEDRRRGFPWVDGSARRIVAGRNTSIYAVPWQVSLREKSFPICGGSVITDIWLITAAHCLLRSRPADLTVRLGSSWKTHGGDIYDVKECLVHPRYISKAKVNDVGLMRLYSPLRFSASVLPITLVARDTRVPADKYTVVSGWGKLKEGGDSPKFLQSTTIKTIAMKLCRSSGLDRRAIDPHAMFCAGSYSQNQPDACQGDSGGPIVSDGVLIGVVSWGLGCARGNFPGVYTRLASHVLWDWVHTHITRTYDYNNTVM